MRPWISPMLLGAALITAGAMPAAADNMSLRSREVVRSGHAQALFLHNRFLHRNSTVGPFGFGGPLIVPGGYSSGGIASGMPPVIMLGEAPAVAASPARPSAVEQRPSVETTAEGVVVVRGPGSHHIGY